jgi:hypothetical protein
VKTFGYERNNKSNFLQYISEYEEKVTLSIQMTVNKLRRQFVWDELQANWARQVLQRVNVAKYETQFNCTL